MLGRRQQAVGGHISDVPREVFHPIRLTGLPADVAIRAADRYSAVTRTDAVEVDGGNVEDDGGSAAACCLAAAHEANCAAAIDHVQASLVYGTAKSAGGFEVLW